MAAVKKVALLTPSSIRFWRPGKVAAAKNGCPTQTEVTPSEAVGRGIPLVSGTASSGEDQDLVELNPYAVEVRYADDWIEPQLTKR